jgi:VWFA-related protein
MLASLALAATMVAAGVPQVPPVFAAQAESVYLDVFVSRDGEPVGGLTADDFDVLAGGRHVPVELVPSDAAPISAVLVLDTSLSVAGGRLDQLRQACTAFARALAPQDEALLLTFANAVHLRSPAGADRAALEEALAHTHAGGRTALFDAVFSGLLMAPSLPGRPVLIVFSDGVDTVSWTGGPDSLALARQSSTLVYAVGVASELLQGVVDATGGRTLSESGKGIGNAFLRVLDDLRHRYLLRFDAGEPTPGWRPLEVKLKHQHADLRYRPGYTRRPSEFQ